MRTTLGQSARITALAAAVATIAACASAGQFVWVQDLPDAELAAARTDYFISPGDTINVRVYEQEPLTTRARVRPDGKVALPLVGEVDVAGKHPVLLAQELEGRFGAFITKARVTVNVEESPPSQITVVGEVGHPGPVVLTRPTGVLEALANAGGPTEYADRDRIFVLRRGPVLRRIRFTYDALTHNDPRALAFSLQGGDVLVVE